MRFAVEPKTVTHQRKDRFMDQDEKRILEVFSDYI